MHDLRTDDAAVREAAELFDVLALRDPEAHHDRQVVAAGAELDGSVPEGSLGAATEDSLAVWLFSERAAWWGTVCGRAVAAGACGRLIELSPSEYVSELGLDSDDEDEVQEEVDNVRAAWREVQEDGQACKSSLGSGLAFN